MRATVCSHPIGIQSFEQIIEDGYVYLDKTALVYDLDVYKRQPLDARKKLKRFTLRALSNEVVVGLMGITLQK